MLEIDANLLKGILYVRLRGVLNKQTLGDFERELNYLLYKQGMHYFVFDFKDIRVQEINIDIWLENKFFEIFLECGKVIMYEFDGKLRNKNNQFNKLLYAREECDFFNYLSL